MDPITTGALIMGGTSLLGGLMSNNSQADATRAQARAQENAQRMAIQEQRQAYGDIQPMWDPYQQAGSAALTDLRTGDFQSPVMGQFEYGKTAQDFLDPSAQFQKDEAMRQMQALYGNDMYSGGAMKGLQDRAMQFAQTDYGNAYGRMQQDKDFSYQDYVNQFNSKSANVQSRYNQLANMANLGVQGANALTNARTGNANQISGMIQQQGQAQGQAAAAGGLQAAANWQTATNPNLLGPMVAQFGGQQQQQGYGQQYQNRMGVDQYSMQNPYQQNVSPYTPSQGNLLQDTNSLYSPGVGR